MKKFVTLIAAAALLAGTGAAFAQPGHDDHNPPGHDAHSAPPSAHDDHGSMQMKGPGMMMQGPSHANWKKGGHIEKNDWSRGSKVDYRSHHLKAPPRGYEWRQVDNNYVLAAAATGLIASVILASH